MPPEFDLYDLGEDWQIQSRHGEVGLISTTRPHDGWMGINHMWFLPGSDSVVLGDHLTARGYGQELPRPTRQQVIQAHLEIAGMIDTGQDIHPLERWALPDGHQCDFSMYDLSESPLREFVQCHLKECVEPGRVYCDEHEISICAYHATFCEEADCTHLECPACAPKCDICGQPACPYHIRECLCGADACTNANAHCWDFCEDCGDRICKNHATIIGDDWYCEEHTPRGNPKGKRTRIGRDDVIACDLCGERGFNLNELGEQHSRACPGILVVMHEEDAWELYTKNPARRSWLTGDLHRRIGALLKHYETQIAAAKQGKNLVQRLAMPNEYEILASKLGCLPATVADWYGRGGGFVHSPGKRYAATINALYEEEFL